MKYIIILITLFYSGFSMANDLVKDVFNCQVNTRKLMSKSYDPSQNNSFDEYLYSLKIIEKELKSCKEKTLNLQKNLPDIRFKQKLYKVLTFTEKRIVIDLRVLKILSKRKITKQDNENFNDLKLLSRVIRSSELEGWDDLQASISNKKDLKKEESSPFMTTMFIIMILVGFSRLARNKDKKGDWGSAAKLMGKDIFMSLRSNKKQKEYLEEREKEDNLD